MHLWYRWDIRLYTEGVYEEAVRYALIYDWEAEIWKGFPCVNTAVFLVLVHVKGKLSGPRIQPQGDTERWPGHEDRLLVCCPPRQEMTGRWVQIVNRYGKCYGKLNQWTGSCVPIYTIGVGSKRPSPQATVRYNSWCGSVPHPVAFVHSKFSPI